MLPRLGEFIANGASKHRLKKGIILVSQDTKREANLREQQWIVENMTHWLATQAEFKDFSIEPDLTNPAVIFVVTPFLPVHSFHCRNTFFNGLAVVLGYLSNIANTIQLKPLGTGTNPFASASNSQTPTLCADIHEIEILDDLEVSRIYNLFRQYLPELIAISSHSALSGGQLQKDLSTRMRLNPTSFTPPALTLFSHRQIDRLKRSIRKEYGLSDLTQLDVNPVSTNTVTLRFIDAQSSLKFIRAQVLLFQAIAIHGRTLARQGSQTPNLGPRIIGTNKALAIEAGPAAIFKPDRKRGVKERKTSWYQDAQITERASSALLQALEYRTVNDHNTIIHGLQTLRARFSELAAVIMGAELRRRGEACLANYGEYQVRLFYVHQKQWQEQLLADYTRLITQPEIDLLCEYNESKYQDLSKVIEADWHKKLVREQNQNAHHHPQRYSRNKHQERRNG